MGEQFFHNGLVKEELHPDVWFLAGIDDHDPIPAHKIIMGARSKFLKELCNDGDEDDHANEEPIILYEMNHEALKVFIEFMYVGNSIDSVKLKTHARSLYLAADLYQIQLLRELCRYQLISSLNMRNAVDLFEISKDDPREKPLHDKARCYILCHMNEIAFTDEFNSFVERNSSLTVELIKYMVMVWSRQNIIL